MPLRDHFRAPVSPRWPWASIHSQWASTITEQLNSTPLPPQYFAVPRVHLGGQAQVDVGTLHDEAGELQVEAGNGAVATAVWAPPRPPVVVPVEFTDQDVFEIQVRNETEGLRLVAAIELVSPANKDRPASCEAFAIKCAAYLQADVSLVVVDVVTERQESLHAELLRLLRLDNEPAAVVPAALYAVAYRAAGTGPRQRLELWPEALALGAPLPLLPLWIAPDLAVPLDLEASYTMACASLRMRG
jgi:hypothetical protein